MSIVLGFPASSCHPRHMTRGQLTERMLVSLGALLGRIHVGTTVLPFALALENQGEGISIDAVLLHERDISVLFSFAHSYCHVEEGRPYDLIRFIRSQVPRKRLSELYISFGHTRHGKTELFRELKSHIGASDDRFVEPPRKKGFVMSVFHLPGFEMVFKVIKDTFPPQKTMAPSQVMEKYRLVFHMTGQGGWLTPSPLSIRNSRPIDLMRSCSRAY